MRVLRRWLGRERTRGQSLVEFALTLPLLIVLILGLVDVGRLVYQSSTLSQAAREGARVATVQAYWVGRNDTGCNQPGGPTCPASLNELRTNVLAATNRNLVPFGALADEDLHLACHPDGSAPSGEWTSPTQNCTDAADRVPGADVSVRVTMEFTPITPIIAQLIGSLNLDGSATMSIN